jgi:signal transduction histidine kinase
MAIEPLSPENHQPECSSIKREGVSVPSELDAALIPQLQQQIQQQRQRHTLLNEIISTIRTNRDLNQVYRLATHGLVQTIQANRGLLMMFKYVDPRQRQRSATSIPKTKATVIVESQLTAESCSIARSVDDSGWEGTMQPTFWASECDLCQQILLGEAQVYFANQAVELLNRSEPFFQLSQFPALLMLPLESQGTILGCLVLQQDCPRDWSEEEIAFVKLVAAQLSTAIIQTRSFQQVQSVVHERTAQLQRSLEVQAKLYEKTRQQVEQLRRLNEEREEFLSTISHELLTPLTSMTLAIRMLRQAELDSTRRQKYLDILEQQCVQETHLINDLLALRKLEAVSNSTQMQKLDLRQFIQNLLQSIEPEWKEKDLKLLLHLSPHPLLLYSDSDSLHRILLELLTNARKYADPGSTVDLTVEYQGELPARQIQLIIRNIGAGITADELPQIFDKFRRGQGVTKQAIPGTGLGLALVKSLVEHLDGTITAASRPLADSPSWETWFTVTLPQIHNGQTCATA